MSDAQIIITDHGDHLTVAIDGGEPIHHHLFLPGKREEVIEQLTKEFSLIGTVTVERAEGSGGKR